MKLLHDLINAFQRAMTRPMDLFWLALSLSVWSCLLVLMAYGSYAAGVLMEIEGRLYVAVAAAALIIVTIRLIIEDRK
jgi:hypothetical protein